MISVTDFLTIDHLIFVSVTLPYLPLVFRRLTILTKHLNKYNLLPNVVSKIAE